MIALPPSGRRDRLSAGDGIATQRRDLPDHLLGGAGINALALHAGARIVDHDPSPPSIPTAGHIPPPTALCPPR